MEKESEWPFLKESASPRVTWQGGGLSTPIAPPSILTASSAASPVSLPLILPSAFYKDPVMILGPLGNPGSFPSQVVAVQWLSHV